MGPSDTMIAFQPAETFVHSAKWCQVRLWHETDMAGLVGEVRCWVNSGKHLLAASISPYMRSAAADVGPDGQHLTAHGQTVVAEHLLPQVIGAIGRR